MVPLSQAKVKSQQTNRIGRVKEKFEDERSVAVRRDRYVAAVHHDHVCMSQ
jgi:hypothetical protein